MIDLTITEEFHSNQDWRNSKPVWDKEKCVQCGDIIRLSLITVRVVVCVAVSVLPSVSAWRRKWRDYPGRLGSELLNVELSIKRYLIKQLRNSDCGIRN